jgi:hypothetical protein
VRTTAEWLDYFRTNADNHPRIPWAAGAEVTPTELATIARSLQAWQLGETSDGRHLLAAAARYAARVSDAGFVAMARLFILEEQRHGELLGKFLDLAGVSRRIGATRCFAWPATASPAWRSGPRRWS